MSVSTSILGQVPISSLKLNTLYLYSMSITSFFSLSIKHDFSKSIYFSNISLSVMYFFHHWDITMDIFLLSLLVVSLSLVYF